MKTFLTKSKLAIVMVAMLTTVMAVSCNCTSQIKLAELSAESYPVDDTWIITDTLASTTDFIGLNAALNAISESGRKISLEFPNLKAFPGRALYGQNALMSISANAAKVVETNAFAGCVNLQSIAIPQVVYIGSNTFNSCRSLTSIDAPKVVTINYNAFACCNVTASVETPVAIIKEEGDGISLSELTSDNYPVENTWIITDAIATRDDLSGLRAALNAISDSDRKITLEFPNLKYLPSFALRDDSVNKLTALASISSNSVEVIGDYAFGGDGYLTSVEFPQAVYIGAGAFYGINVGYINIPNIVVVCRDAFNRSSHRKPILHANKSKAILISAPSGDISYINYPDYFFIAKDDSDKTCIRITSDLEYVDCLMIDGKKYTNVKFPFQIEVRKDFVCSAEFKESIIAEKNCYSYEVIGASSYIDVLGVIRYSIDFNLDDTFVDCVERRRVILRATEHNK